MPAATAAVQPNPVQAGRESLLLAVVGRAPAQQLVVRWQGPSSTIRPNIDCFIVGTRTAPPSGEAGVYSLWPINPL